MAKGKEAAAGLALEAALGSSEGRGIRGAKCAGRRFLAQQKDGLQAWARMVPWLRYRKTVQMETSLRDLATRLQVAGESAASEHRDSEFLASIPHLSHPKGGPLGPRGLRWPWESHFFLPARDPVLKDSVLRGRLCF